jgi:hypothetical protein
MREEREESCQSKGGPILGGSHVSNAKSGQYSRVTYRNRTKSKRLSKWVMSCKETEQVEAERTALRTVKMDSVSCAFFEENEHAVSLISFEYHHPTPARFVNSASYLMPHLTN